jgi:hypothetical protein
LPAPNLHLWIPAASAPSPTAAWEAVRYLHCDMELPRIQTDRMPWRDQASRLRQSRMDRRYRYGVRQGAGPQCGKIPSVQIRIELAVIRQFDFHRQTQIVQLAAHFGRDPQPHQRLGLYRRQQGQ